jgi:hypothetical protein
LKWLGILIQIEEHNTKEKSSFSGAGSQWERQEENRRPFPFGEVEWWD